MEVEDHNDSLTSFDILEPFDVCFVDDHRSLHIGNRPMPGKLFSISVHNTYRFHFYAHIEIFPELRMSQRYVGFLTAEWACLKIFDWDFILFYAARPISAASSASKIASRIGTCENDHNKWWINR